MLALWHSFHLHFTFLPAKPVSESVQDEDGLSCLLKPSVEHICAFGEYFANASLQGESLICPLKLCTVLWKQKHIFIENLILENLLWLPTLKAGSKSRVHTANTLSCLCSCSQYYNLSCRHPHHIPVRQVVFFSQLYKFQAETYILRAFPRINLNHRQTSSVLKFSFWSLGLFLCSTLTNATNTSSVLATQHLMQFFRHPLQFLLISMCTYVPLLYLSQDFVHCAPRRKLGGAAT